MRDLGDWGDCCDLDRWFSVDTGVTWDEDQNIPPGGTTQGEYRMTDIVTSGDIVMLVFINNTEIHFVKSTNNGGSWGSVETVATGDVNSHVDNPRFGLYSNTIHVLYSNDEDNTFQGKNYEIYHKKSTDGGDNWSAMDPLTDVANNSWRPAVSVNANAIHVVWADNRHGVANFEIYYDKSTDNGASWMHSTDDGYRFTYAGDESEYPDIIAYTDQSYSAVHVVWMDARNDSPGPGVFYRRSTDNGATWQDPIRLYANAYHPAITADTRGLYVVCVYGGNLYYFESTDYGANWDTLQVTNSSDTDSLPDIFADDMGRHIVFCRDPSGTNAKIWYIQRDILTPAAPTNLHTTPFGRVPPVNLYWDPNSEADIEEYKVSRTLLGSPFFGVIGTTSDTSYTDDEFSQYDTFYVYAVQAVDLAHNISDLSDTIVVYVPSPGERLNLGQPTPSLYTIQRSGYYSWGKTPDSSADYGSTLKYCFEDLIPQNIYTFGFGFFEPINDSGRVVAVKSGTVNLQPEMAIPESIVYTCIRIPEPLYSQGELNLVIPSTSYESVLSEILIWEWEEKSGGPQSSGTEEVNLLSLQVLPSIGNHGFAIQYAFPAYTSAALEIYDCAGKVVYQNKELNPDGVGYLYWDKSNLPSGVYFVRLTTIQQEVLQKIVLLR